MWRYHFFLENNLFWLDGEISSNYKTLGVDVKFPRSNHLIRGEKIGQNGSE